MKHYNLSITGRVQGVWFRGSTRDKAKQLGIKGYVKNMPDGSVYIEAEGNEERLGDFIAWCRQGPPMANVDNVKIEDGEVKNYKVFDVKH